MVLIRGAVLWLLVALLVAWCMVSLNLGLPGFHAVFQGKVSRLLQAHLDFLLMSALLFGFYAAGVPLRWHVRWTMVVGAFTNPSVFLLQAMFPVLDMPMPSEDAFPALFRLYAMVSVVITTYGFGGGALCVLRSTFRSE
ncbi:MAG TPA: hypothetical protein VI457_11220 [Methylococcaceae bacterium]|nr:hypothetical protein [Methylococcaceae bacterium]